ncbi:hypothetical protein [Gimesia sp.]|uniref:hypothetical protein n=1 Tax=Gimesia sp. TaxID=2024833 RepID=UPI003A92E6FE
MKIIFLLSQVVFLFTSLSAFADDPDETDRYLQIVKSYADAMLEHGTDTYGKAKSPLLLSLMERKKLEPFTKMPPAPNGIRQGDRVTTHGSNVNLDQNLYRVLYALSEITGDPRYQKSADAALKAFLYVTPSPETNLFAWGEHLCWDLKTDRPGTWESKAIHEPKRPTVLFEKFYELNPAATINYCDGLWEHQLFTDKQGKKDGNFSRHAAYDKHDPRQNYDFPKEGGYFIHDWARAYAKTQDPRFLKYIDVLASRYQKKLDKHQNNLIEFDSIRNYADTSASISLAIDCFHAAQLLEPGELQENLLKLSQSIDLGLQTLPHQVEGPGFVEYVTAESKIKLYAHKQNGGYSFLWNIKYGRKTTGMLGVLFYSRYSQLPEGAVKERYREMILQAADRYLSSDPDMAERPWPVEIGIAVYLQLAAYEMTGKEQYLNRARHFARLGIKHYWSDSSPLPKADPGCNHYENVTRADTLALSLLKLYVTEKSLNVPLGISDIDR